MDREQIVGRLRGAGCVFAEDEARLLLGSGAADLEALVARRVAGEPLEYLLGWADFAGLRIAVTDGVFVPRRRTEFLARTAIELARAVSVPPPGPRPARSSGDEDRAQLGPGGESVRPVVLDLCAGAGAIAALVAAELEDAVELAAAELDPAAVACARRNLPTHVPVYESDLLAAVPPELRGRVDVLVANVPYVPTDDIALMPPEAREYERRVALDGGADGLDVARRVAHQAAQWLAPGGHLLIETSEAQAPAAAAVFERAGLCASVRGSEQFYATVVLGRYE